MEGVLGDGFEMAEEGFSEGLLMGLYCWSILILDWLGGSLHGAIGLVRYQLKYLERYCYLYRDGGGLARSTYPWILCFPVCHMQSGRCLTDRNYCNSVSSFVAHMHQHSPIQSPYYITHQRRC